MAKKVVGGLTVRHFTGAASGLLIGLNADKIPGMQDNIEAIQTLLSWMGVPPEIQAAIGGLGVTVAFLLSYREKLTR